MTDLIVECVHCRKAVAWERTDIPEPTMPVVCSDCMAELFVYNTRRRHMWWRVRGWFSRGQAHEG